MEIALRVVQFWSEIKLVITNRDFVITRLISDQIALHKVQLLLLIVRKDKASVQNKINKVNVILKRMCKQNNWTYIDHSNIDYTCLNRRGLHLNWNGSTLISKNLNA